MSAYQNYDQHHRSALSARDVSSQNLAVGPLHSTPGSFHPLLAGVPACSSLFNPRQYPYDHGRQYQPMPPFDTYGQHYQLDSLPAAYAVRPTRSLSQRPPLPPLSMPPRALSVQNYVVTPSSSFQEPTSRSTEGATQVPEHVSPCHGGESPSCDWGLENNDSDLENRPRGTTAGRKKIKIQYIQEKSRRHITFSKRKSGIMKKAFELSTLTGTQLLLIIVSESGLVYTFSTPKLQPIVTKPQGKSLIQACLNAPDCPRTPPQEAPSLSATAYPSPHPVTPVTESKNDQFGGRRHQYASVSAKNSTSSANTAPRYP